MDICKLSFKLVLCYTNEYKLQFNYKRMSMLVIFQAFVKTNETEEYIIPKKKRLFI